MDAEKRHRRTENFSEGEISTMLALIAKHDEILNRKGQHNKHIFKEKAWREIASELSLEWGVERTWKQIRAKYDKWKAEQKKKRSGEPIIQIYQDKKLDDVQVKSHISNEDLEINKSIVLSQDKKLDEIQSKSQILNAVLDIKKSVALDQDKTLNFLELKPQNSNGSESEESISLSCDSFDHDYVGENFKEEHLLEDPFSGLDQWQKQFQVLQKSNLEDDNDSNEAENEVVRLRIELLKKEYVSRQKREEELHREKIKILKQEQIINANKILLQQMEIKRIKLSIKK